VAKPKRRQQQHLRQEQSRKRTYSVGSTAPKDIYKPGFPMNLLGNLKFFSIVGIAATAVMVLAAFLGRGNNSNANDAVDLPTATPTSSATVDPSATATTDPKQFTQSEQVIDATKNTYTATIKTDKGDIVMNLFADKAPKTVNNFVFLAQKGYYNGITFHRVVADFIVQGGDPTGTGTGGPGYTTEEDQNDLKNLKGYVSMAKAGAVTNFGSQFFINLKDNPSLDTDSSIQKRFYPFAQVTPESMAVVAQIAQGDVMRSVTITETPK
jgi:peptidyl-prolyl cis-trans isomerase B (cyclophilin B)